MANIHDIADLAGVSIATVSRALSKSSSVRPATQRKIDEAIDKLNYRPNMLAAGLRRQRSNNIIVAVPNISNAFTASFVQGIENLARESGFRVLLAITEAEQALLDSYADMIAGKQADGLIVLDTTLPQIVERAANDAAVPVVMACEYPADLHVSRVRHDNVEAMAEMVAHLVKLGHERIATVTGPIEQRMGRDRLQGFRLGLRRGGLDPDAAPSAYGDFTLASGHRAAAELLARGETFTALCCANDEMAIGALSCLHEAGLAVPADVSVTGFDNLSVSAFAIPALTTMEVPIQGTGEAAMRLMLDVLRDPEEPTREVILPHKLVVRGSTARAAVVAKGRGALTAKRPAE